MWLRRIALPLFVLLMSTKGHAQTSITFSGTVVDEKNNQPVSSATIFDVTNNHGTFTDQDGKFSLVISQTPAAIRISHIGYSKKTIEISASELKRAVKGVYTLQINLKPAPVEISPVEVLGGNQIRAYNKPWIPVIDFEFSGPNLLLLVYENRKYDVRLVNGDDSTLLKTTLSFVPESFFKDCLDQLHVISAVTNYRVAILRDTIVITESSSRKDFDSVVVPCTAATEEAFYFGKLGPHNQSVFYFKSMRETDDEKIFALVRDSIGEQLAVEELQRAIGLSPYANAQMSDIYRSADLVKARTFLNDLWFYQKIRTIPVYDPLMEIRDSLYLFNHAMHRLSVYDEKGNLSRMMPLNYSKDKTWNKQIIVDEANGDVYLAFISNGYITLKKFDLSSGDFIGETQLEQALFPESIKIRNGIAYYLLQNSENYIGYNLFMQHLD